MTEAQILEIDDIDTALAQQDEQTALVLAEQELGKLLADDPNLLDMWGGENLEEGDTGQPPRLKLCQKQSPDLDVPAGHYYNTLTSETFDGVEVIPLLVLAASRVEYFRPFTKGESPYCASDDGQIPRQQTERRPLQEPKPGPCSTCTQAGWSTDENGKRIPPPCTRQRQFMVMARKSGEVMQLTMQKTGTPAARQFTALMKSAGIRKSVMLVSQFVKNPAGDYYEPLAAAGSLLKTDELLRVIEARTEIDRLVRSGDIIIAADEDADFNGGNGGNGASHAHDDGNKGGNNQSDGIPF